MWAYYFDWVDDYVISESPQVYNLFGTWEHFSVSVWAKPIKYEDWSLLIWEQNGWKYYANSSFWLRSNKSWYTCVIWTHVSNNDSYTYRQTTNYMPSVNQWHNVVCVVDWTTMKMYVDSVQVGNVDISWLNTRTVWSNWIYIWRHTNYKTFPWLIDEVIVYERSLSDSEIENYYNYTKWWYSPLYDSLLLMYNFDNVESLDRKSVV